MGADAVQVILFGGIVGGFVAWATYMRRRQHQKPVNILAFQRGVKYKRGKFVALLEPGSYLVDVRTEHVVLVDMRAQPFTLERLPVNARDGSPVLVCISSTFQVSDPVKAISTTANYVQSESQLLLDSVRRVITSKTVPELGDRREHLAAEILIAVREKASEMGVSCLNLELTDLNTPGGAGREHAGFAPPGSTTIN